MKTTTKITILMVAAAISMSQMLKADDTIQLPVISKPAILDEGTQRELSAAQIAELLPWAKDSKLFLTDLLENINGLATADKIDRLVEGITQVVGDSSPKNSELLMRYALNRGLVVKGLLDKQMSDDVVGTSDAKLRVLRASVQMALKYYDIDMGILNKKAKTPFKAFGVEYFSFLYELNKSVFDASAQYAIQRTALEWLQWDLYRDLNNAQFAPQILKINNGLRLFPTTKLTDAQSIAYIRQMKKLTAGMDFEGVKVVATDASSDNDQSVLFSKKSQDEQEDSNSKVIIAGDRVNNGSYVGTVREAFNNGNISVSVDGYTGVATWVAADVGKGVRCYKRMCKNDRMNNGSYVGTVSEVFTNGKIKTSYDGYTGYTYLKVDEVGKGISSLKGLVVGGRVNYGSYVGTAKEIFDNNTVKISVDGYSGYAYKNISELGF